MVASEVRGLAGRSAEAAREIMGSDLRQRGRSVAQGSNLVDKAGATMQEVVQSIRRVTALVGEISSASAEQRSACPDRRGHCPDGPVTQQNAALVEQIAAAATGLSTQAQELVQAVAVFPGE